MITFERPCSPNCLQYLRQLWHPQPILNLIGRDNKANPCEPRTTNWYMYKHVLLELFKRERGWISDFLLVVLEEDWRLRPTDNAAMLVAPKGAEFKKRPDGADYSGPPQELGSDAQPGTVAALREKLQAMHLAQALGGSSLASTGPAAGESRPPPVREARTADPTDGSRFWDWGGHIIYANEARSGFKPTERDHASPMELEDRGVVVCSNLIHPLPPDADYVTCLL